MNSKHTLLTLILLSVLSCTRGNFYEHQLLSTLPAETHSGKVDVYFEGDGEPKEDYLEYYDLRVVKKGIFNDRQMVNFLKIEAQKKGLDGVAQLKKWDESEEKTTFANVLLSITDPEDDDYTTIINYSIIEGKGFKYVKNIDLTKSVKTGKVYADNVLIGEIKYLPNGLIAETTAENDNAEALLDLYYKLSESYLLKEEYDWQTLHHADGRIDVRRKFRMNDWLLARVRVKYNPNLLQQIRNIRLTENEEGSSAKTSKISYKYNGKGQVINRTISGGYNMKQDITYHNGLIKETALQYGGKSYRIVYDFFQQSDLKKLIQKVEEPISDEVPIGKK